MSQVFSEINKVVNVLPFMSHADSSGPTSDVVNMESYKKCTFILATGASAANTPVLTVLAGISNSSAATAIAYKYRTQIGAVPPAAASDVPSALTDIASSGFAITTGKDGGVYIIEVDAATVAAAGTAYNHVCLAVSTGATHAAHIYGVVAVLSEPRYPQGILVTAID